MPSKDKDPDGSMKRASTRSKQPPERYTDEKKFDVGWRQAQDDAHVMQAVTRARDGAPSALKSKLFNVREWTTSPTTTLEIVTWLEIVKKSTGIDVHEMAVKDPGCVALREFHAQASPPDVEAVVSDLVSEAGLHGHSLGAWDEARECLEHAMELAQVMCMACSNVRPMHVCARASS